MFLLSEKHGWQMVFRIRNLLVMWHSRCIPSIGQLELTENVCELAYLFRKYSRIQVRSRVICSIHLGRWWQTDGRHMAHRWYSDDRQVTHRWCSDDSKMMADRWQSGVRHVIDRWQTDDILAMDSDPATPRFCSTHSQLWAIPTANPSQRRFYPIFTLPPLAGNRLYTDASGMWMGELSTD